MTGLCLAGGGAAIKIATAGFVLSWVHTIEHTRWSERWEIRPEGLVVAEAAIETSGAGMDPPDGARLEDGRYVWTPSVPPISELVLRRAPEAGDWTLCAAGACRTIAAWLTADADPVRLSPADGACAPPPD
ncbi:DUF1850 domain-containing protein [Propylenella binzhouense]|uniref:DUF1850 domain-containing protein n=1 Tax=Propylenella binzhouense TaxID=2555902 RepID=A0A964T8L3_9HYPH|nr:DUF1850 domain-containing protein [Propylenella binzhouense]MYZ49862.1 DUF1850 domain-containing protein [Propylenella binzhouense]